MTFCYAFNISPDGIGIISDTRLSRITTFGDIEYDLTQYQKIYCPTDNSFLAFAGTISHLAEQLNGLKERLVAIEEQHRYQAFLDITKEKYTYLWSTGYFNSSNIPNMAIIYGDVRHQRGSTKCRLLKLDFGVSNNRPSIGIGNANSGEWLAIGWTVEGRRALSSAASNALGELESRSLIIRSPNREELQRFTLNHGQLPVESSMVVLDSSGERNGNFRSVLREYTNNLPSSSPTTMRFDPTLLFSGAAQKAIERKMTELRQQLYEHHDGVSDTWSIANVTLREGFRIFSDEELTTIRSIYEGMIR